MTAPYLTARQKECIRLAAAGHDQAEIARRLGLAAPTVRIHLGYARDALGARNVAHAVAIAMHHGIVTPDHLELP